jgi:hypothetical protein
MGLFISKIFELTVAARISDANRGLMLLAISKAVVPFGNWRTLPSGNVMFIIIVDCTNNPANLIKFLKSV